MPTRPSTLAEIPVSDFERRFRYGLSNVVQEADLVDFPKPGTVLWGVDSELANDVFRSGAATKPNTEFLRFIDIGDPGRDGRISEDEAEALMVEPGKGISLFLERMAPEGMVATTPDIWAAAGKAKGKIQWWGIDRNHPVPAGLELVYDGLPPGHCTLTVTRRMTVKAFLALVAMVPFSKRQLDLLVPIA